MNSHDGSTAVVAATTPVRVVCQNTLNWGLRQARQKFSIRHTEAVTQRVYEARRVLDISINYYQQFKLYGDQLLPSAAPSVSFAKCWRNSTLAVSETRRVAVLVARARTSRIASLSCVSGVRRRATRPALSGPPSTRSSSTATGYDRFARARSALAACWTMRPRRLVPYSSSPLPERPEPGGPHACRARLGDALAFPSTRIRVARGPSVFAGASRRAGGIQ